jgi:hypothetical protein
MTASHTLEKAPVHKYACDDTLWCLESGYERLAALLSGTRSLQHPE